MLLRRDDIDTALKIFQDAKEQGKFISDATCLLLLNSMARTGQLEHFESGKLHMGAFRLSGKTGGHI